MTAARPLPWSESWRLDDERPPVRPNVPALTYEAPLPPDVSRRAARTVASLAPREHVGTILAALGFPVREATS